MSTFFLDITMLAGIGRSERVWVHVHFNICFAKEIFDVFFLCYVRQVANIEAGAFVRHSGDGVLSYRV